MASEVSNSPLALCPDFPHLKHSPPSPCLCLSRAGCVHWVVCAICFRIQGWFDGCHTSLSTQRDFCPLSYVIEKSSSIHLHVAFKIFGILVRSRRSNTCTHNTSNTDRQTRRHRHTTILTHKHASIYTKHKDSNTKKRQLTQKSHKQYREELWDEREDRQQLETERYRRDKGRDKRKRERKRARVAIKGQK